MFSGNITDVVGILAGNATCKQAKTGVTAIIAPEGAVCAADIRGGAPGTRETDLMQPGNLVQKAHAILLCGGSAYGLDAASGAMKYLERKGIGLPVGPAVVPIVGAAVLFDLTNGSSTVRPDAAMGMLACINATSKPLAQGLVGAGTGATVGKLNPKGIPQAGGLGTASITLANGTVVAAVIAVNACGDVYHPHTMEFLQGARDASGNPAPCMDALLGGAKVDLLAGTNTSIGVVATSANLTKEQLKRVAMIAHDGLARTIQPVHTLHDGDSIFALATGQDECDITMICAAAVECVARAVANAVLSQGE